MKKILQLCNGFFGSKVHYNLYSNLDNLGVSQTILSYIRPEMKIEQQPIETSYTNTIKAGLIKPYHHYLFHLKIYTLYSDLRKRINLNEIGLVHASTLFSDGGVAYLLHKKYGIPYIVAVRNTDVNDFLQKAPHVRPIGRKILKNAQKIIFISPAIEGLLFRHPSIKKILPQIKDKFIICPNGVDDYWLDNKVTSPKNNHNVCYVGDFSPNKNVARLIEAVVSLKEEIPDIHLDIVGGGHRADNEGDDTVRITKLIDSYPGQVNYWGKIYDKDKLRELYSKNAVFAMPSIHETFGLVYIEALSQCLRVLYTKEQGLDGVFKENVGEAVNPLSIDDIKLSLRKLLLDPDNYTSNDSLDLERFRWSSIALLYKELYRDFTL